MNSKNTTFRDTAAVALGQALGAAAMTAVFAILGKFTAAVALGALVGAAVATANFFLLAFFANRAADMAAQGDTVGGQRIVQLSYMGRMLGTFLVLILCAKSGLFHPLALVLPLAFTRPALTIAEIFRKKGEKTA